MVQSQKPQKTQSFHGILILGYILGFLSTRSLPLPLFATMIPSDEELEEQCYNVHYTPSYAGHRHVY